MMIFRAALVAAALCAASGAAAQTEEWRYAGSDPTAESAIDINSFSGPRTHRTTRVAVVPAAGGDVSGPPGLDHLIMDVAIDCDARMFDIVHVGFYDQPGSLLNETDAPSSPQSISAGDFPAAVANAVCDGVALTTQSFPSVAAFSAWVKAAPARP